MWAHAVVGFRASIPTSTAYVPTATNTKSRDQDGRRRQALLRDVPLKWRQVLAVEQVIDEVNRRFGEDTADESIRSAINEAKAMLQVMAESLRVLGHEVELVDEPKEEQEFFREVKSGGRRVRGERHAPLGNLCDESQRPVTHREKLSIHSPPLTLSA